MNKFDSEDQQISLAGGPRSDWGQGWGVPSVMSKEGGAEGSQV